MSISERLANQQAHIKAIYKILDGLKAKVKKLEQQDSYYPTQEEISSIKEVRNLNG